jgi:DHA2 family multidrug resistance protein-like MFS transporter
MIYGLKEIAQDGPSWLAAGAIFAGGGLGVAFIRRQLTLADPMIDVRLFAKPAFGASVATYGLTIFVLFGSFLFLPQYLQLVRGLSPLAAGIWGVPSSLAFIGGAMLTPALARRARPAVVMSIGLVIAAGGFAFFTQLTPTTSFVAYFTASVVFALGSSPVFTMTNDLIIGSAPPERAGAAAGISETSAEFNGALGIAVFGSIGVATYRSILLDASLPGVGPETLGAARDTLGGAIAVSAQLPPALGSLLVDASREAFMAGIHVCAAISAVGSLVLAAFVFAKLRSVERRAPIAS